jgi:hypothetical protein
MAWPLSQDYNEAIQNLGDSATKQEGRGVRPEGQD